MVEYRPVPDADIDAWSRLLAYAFRPADPYEPIESVEDLPPPATLGDRRGLYDGDELRCTGAHHWFRLRVRGTFREVPGLSAVSTPPRYRRQGLVRRLLVDSLHEYCERGAGLCALWPFSHPFYRRFGWGTCSRRGRTTCEPDALAGIDAPASGRFEPACNRDDRETNGGEHGEFVALSADDWGALDRVYRATNSQGLAMDRTEAWWRKRVFQNRDDDPYVAGWVRNGRLAGYLVYDIEAGEGAEDGPRMIVSELGYVDFEAYRALLALCRYHDSQVSAIEVTGPVDTMIQIQDLARDPRDVEVEIEPGPMIRIVDVREALSTLSYPDGIETDLTIDLSDDLAEWNDGRFRLSITAGTGTCKRTDSEDDPDLETSIATLSQTVVGFRSIDRAERVGDFDVASLAAREALVAAFPTEETFLREGF